MSFGLALGLPRNRLWSAMFSPLSYFAASEQGIWLDPSDMSTMFQDSAGATPVTAVEQPVGRILDKSGRGNHATQATTASKPVLSARKNLLTYTEVFTNAAWVKTGSGTGVAPIVTDDYLGELGVTRIQVDRGTADVIGDHSIISQSNAGANAGATYYGTAEVKATTPADIGKTILSRGAANSAYRAITLTADWQAFGAGEAAAGTTISLAYGVRGSLGSSQAADFLIRKVQHEPGTTATRYQRVNTATDYDTVGFHHYAKLDRVDDNMTAAAGGGGTTGIIVCAAIRAGGAGNARTIFSDRGTNTGYRLSVNASNQLVLSAGNGAAHTEVVGPTITAGTDYVVTGWHDGVNLNVQANAGAATSAAFGTATAGTASFTIGKDNGEASGYYGERIYEIVYRRNDASTAGERSVLISYMAAQAGITL